MKDYNPNGIAVPNGNYFAMPFSPQEAKVVLLSVPWDVTVSYGTGTAQGPDAIIEASSQLDFYDFHNPEGWRRGIATVETDYSIINTGRRLREEAEKVIIHLEAGGSADEPYARKKLDRINEASQRLNEYVYAEAKKILSEGRIPGIVGGDHSVSFGAIKAVAENEGRLGILQIDAHADLRDSYGGFAYSHASAMFNALKIDGVSSLVQVAVRDVCSDEMALAASDPRITCFSDHELSRGGFAGVNWNIRCGAIIEKLPEVVYISFDIDGLSPDNCPSTGTPVPGGLSFNQAAFLIAAVVESGRRIAGFDLCEVAPAREGEWDANVGARMLYKLCNLALLSNPE